MHDGDARIDALSDADPTVDANRFSCLSKTQDRVKRAFDLVIVPLCIVILLPLLGLIVLAIRLTSPGPVIFRQPRIGRFNRRFICYKFRTMYSRDCDLLADLQTVRGDARITRVGRVLRKFSLDELPQLFNVIKGDMSLVGPRPHAPLTKADGRLFADIVANYDRRHGVRPGITGLAQVNGYRGETRTHDQVIQRIELDLYYIQTWSIWLDLRILLKTIRTEIYSDHAF